MGFWKKLFGATPKNTKQSLPSSEKPATPPDSKRSNSQVKPPELTKGRDQCLKWVEQAENSGMIQCPFCNTQLKAKNLIKHHDKVHKGKDPGCVSLAAKLSNIRVNPQESKTKIFKPCSQDMAEIEDVRSTSDEDGEVILNLWYVTDRQFIWSLRWKAYVAAGTDEEKTRFLKDRASSNFEGAEEFPIPEDMMSKVVFAGEEEADTSRRACICEHIAYHGGYGALFQDFLPTVPKLFSCSKFRYDPTQALVVITALVEGEDGNLHAKIDKVQSL